MSKLSDEIRYALLELEGDLFEDSDLAEDSEEIATGILDNSGLSIRDSDGNSILTDSSPEQGGTIQSDDEDAIEDESGRSIIWQG